MLDSESFLLGIAAGSGGGGGNPNYVETISGTAANPWGDLDLARLLTAIADNHATVIITMIISGAGTTGSIRPSGVDKMAITGAFYSIQPLALNEAFSAEWDIANGGQLSHFYFTQGGATTDMTAYAPSISTTLKVVHHPLP